MWFGIGSTPNFWKLRHKAFAKDGKTFLNYHLPVKTIILRRYVLDLTKNITGYCTKMPNLYISNEAQSFALLSLSSSEASLCRGEAGERERESALGTMGRRKREESSRLFPLPFVPRALSIFLDYCYCYRDTQREPLRRRERWFHHGKENSASLRGRKHNNKRWRTRRNPRPFQWRNAHESRKWWWRWAYIFGV